MQPEPRPDFYAAPPDVMEIARRAEAKGLRSRARALIERDLYAAYRRLFFDDDGRIKPEAALVLGDLASHAGMGMANISLDHEELTCREGMRRQFLHMVGRFNLSAAKAAQLEHDLTKEK